MTKKTTMFEHSSYAPALAGWLVILGSFPPVKKYPACGELDLQHRDSLIVLLPSLSCPCSHEATLTCLFFGDNFVVTLLGPSLDLLDAGFLLPSEGQPPFDLRTCRQPFEKPMSDLALSTSAADTALSLKPSLFCGVQLSSGKPSDFRPAWVHATPKPKSYVLYIFPILPRVPFDFFPLVRHRGKAQSPRQKKQKEVSGASRDSNSNGHRQNKALSLPADPRKGGQFTPQVVVFHKNDLIDKCHFGCFCGKKQRPPGCLHSRCHWKEVRSICRSQHLKDHVRDGHLTQAQLDGLNRVANQSARKDQVDAWRECFVTLYPLYGDFRNKLNPCYGQRLLDDDSVLQQQANELVESTSNRPTDLPFLRSPVVHRDLHPPSAFSPTDNGGVLVNRFCSPSTQGSELTAPNSLPETPDWHLGGSSRPHLAGQQASTNVTSRLFGLGTPPHPLNGVGQQVPPPIPAPSNWNMAVNPQSERSQQFDSGFTDPYTTWRTPEGSRPSAPTSAALPSMISDTVTTFSDELASLPTNPNHGGIGENLPPPPHQPDANLLHTQTPSTEIVTGINDETPLGPWDLPDFLMDLNIIQHDTVDPPLPYIDPNWTQRKPGPAAGGSSGVGKLGRKRPGEHAP